MVCIVIFIDLVEYLPGDIIVDLLKHLLILFKVYVLDVSPGPFVLIHVACLLTELLPNTLVLLKELLIFVSEFLRRQKLALLESTVSVKELNHLVA